MESALLDYAYSVEVKDVKVIKEITTN